MMTSSLAYFSSSGRSSSRTWRQLMQQKVQKSNRTTLPRRSARVSSLPPEFIHRRPMSSGARTLTSCVEDFVCVAVALVPAEAAVGVVFSGLLVMSPCSQIRRRGGLAGVIVWPARAGDGGFRLVRSRLVASAIGSAPDRFRVVAVFIHARADAVHVRCLADRVLEVPSHAHRHFGRLGGHDSL